MDGTLKVVTRLPLAELWGDDGFTTTSRTRSLTADDITCMLRSGRVHFVVADIGAIPRWVPLVDCYDFWKREVQPHLAMPEAGASLNDFPGGYCYFAAEWSSRDGVSVVVFEMHH